MELLEGLCLEAFEGDQITVSGLRLEYLTVVALA